MPLTPSLGSLWPPDSKQQILTVLVFCPHLCNEPQEAGTLSISVPTEGLAISSLIREVKGRCRGGSAPASDTSMTPGGPSFSPSLISLFKPTAFQPQLLRLRYTKMESCHLIKIKIN